MLYIYKDITSIASHTQIVEQSQLFLGQRRVIHLVYTYTRYIFSLFIYIYEENEPTSLHAIYIFGPYNYLNCDPDNPPMYTLFLIIGNLFLDN